MPNPSDEESVGSRVYQGLVQLTFLCGCGLPTEELMTRFLAAMRSHVPARGLWLFENSRLCASDVGAGCMQQITPPPHQSLGDFTPRFSSDGRLVAPVLPGLTLVVELEPGPAERAQDVVMLTARILGLAWHSEVRSDPAAELDDYQSAKQLFKKRWLRALLRRHQGVTSAARAAGLSRGAIYTLMDHLGVEHPRKTTAVQSTVSGLHPSGGPDSGCGGAITTHST